MLTINLIAPKKVASSEKPNSTTGIYVSIKNNSFGIAQGDVRVGGYIPGLKCRTQLKNLIDALKYDGFIKKKEIADMQDDKEQTSAAWSYLLTPFQIDFIDNAEPNKKLVDWLMEMHPGIPEAIWKACADGLSGKDEWLYLNPKELSEYNWIEEYEEEEE